MRMPPLNRRRMMLLSGAATLWRASSPMAAEEPFTLYQARTIVTGQREETRTPGLKICLRNVLVRVSGDPRLAKLPAVDKLIESPELAVVNYIYRDLYAQRPIRDEQGTRDRPFEMTVDYDPAKIDSMLIQLGSRPWLAPRPTLMIFLAVRHIASDYILSADIAAGSLQRESFSIASWRYAMPIAFPGIQKLDAAGFTVDNLPVTSLAILRELSDAGNGSQPLAGALAWNRELLGWESEWRIESAGAEHRWSVSGGNYDAAFRHALGGAAQILSGNGEPRTVSKK